ncbi:Flagellar hook-associated protein flgL [Alteromonas macleodii]|uniref:flagellar hook-associated protein FlgL n=1 Tax=Alteromonas sp. BZK5 TaxID=1904459 RepID=UPI0016535EFF|nr:flagellar hook-associated protein FlgL [Alteromonas sp. BZK5]MBC6985230.1 flagellar hook-associated protein FlgL [Alteromonas sp. BZK5]
MRISTNQIYDQNMRSIMQNQGDLAKTQEQLATGKKLLKPSDDPVGAANALRLTERLDSLTQFKRNNDLVTGSLELQETVLDSVRSSADRARALAIQSGNGAYTAADREAIASELKQIKLELLDLMNTKDADGNYLYSGFQSGKQAFAFEPASSGNAITFSGDQGKNFINLSESSKVQSTTSGFEVFEDVLGRLKFTVDGSSVPLPTKSTISNQDNFDNFFENNYDPANNNYRINFLASGQAELINQGTGVVLGSTSFASGEPFTLKGMEFEVNAIAGDSFDFSLDAPQRKSMAQTIHEFEALLNDPSTDSLILQEGIADALIGLDNGMERVSLERASIGGRLNIAQSMSLSNFDLQIAAQTTLSSIEDADFAKLSTEFAKQEVALNAALATFPQVSELTLFNFI